MKVQSYISEKLFIILLFIVSLSALIKRTNFLIFKVPVEKDVLLAVGGFIGAVTPLLLGFYYKDLSLKIGCYCLGIGFALIGAIYLVGQSYNYLLNYASMIFFLLASIALFFSMRMEKQVNNKGQSLTKDKIK